MAGAVSISMGNAPVILARLTLSAIMMFMMAANAGIIFGYDNGVTGGVIAHPDFVARFLPEHCGDGAAGTSQWCRFADHTLQLFTSSLFLAGIVGALVGVKTCDTWGRRFTMLLGGVCFMAGSALLSSSFTWAQLVVGRLVLGLGVGLATMATPLYLTEMAPPQYRGAINILFQLCVTVGILMAQVITYYTSHLMYGWRLALALGGVPGALLTLGAALLPETPEYHLSKGRVEEAKEVTRRAYGVEDVDVAISVMQAGVAARKAHPSGLRLLFSRRYLLQLVVVTVIPAAQQLTGINAIMFYAPQVFLATGQSTSNALLSSVIIGLVNVAATLVAIVAVDRMGRRFLLLQGGVQMVVTQVVVAVLLKRISEGVSSQAMAMSLVSMVCLYVAAFAWSWGPLGWLVPTELQPLETRGVGAAVNVVVNFAFTFIIGQLFLTMLCGMKWGVFLFFAGCVAVSCIFIAVALPEVKGLTQEEITAVTAAHPIWGPLTGTAAELPAIAASGKSVEV